MSSAALIDCAAPESKGDPTMTTAAAPTRSCPECGAPLTDDPSRLARVGSGLVPIMCCPTDGAFWWNRWGPAPMSDAVLVAAPG
jgi:hypothetical protein